MINQITLKLDIKPISMNHALKNRVGFGRGRYKPQSTRDWEKSLLFQLNRQSRTLKNFAIGFDPNINFISLDMHIFIPEGNFFTKSGKISRNKGDWDGQIKYTQDVLFDHIGINDCYITEGHVFQHPVKGDYKVEIILSKYDIEMLKK
jgi:hypothetical protein